MRRTSCNPWLLALALVATLSASPGALAQPAAPAEPPLDFQKTCLPCRGFAQEHRMNQDALAAMRAEFERATAALRALTAAVLAGTVTPEQREQAKREGRIAKALEARIPLQEAEVARTKKTLDDCMKEKCNATPIEGTGLLGPSYYLDTDGKPIRPPSPLAPPKSPAPPARPSGGSLLGSTFILDLDGKPIPLPPPGTPKPPSPAPAPASPPPGESGLMGPFVIYDYDGTPITIPPPPRPAPKPPGPGEGGLLGPIIFIDTDGKPLRLPPTPPAERRYKASCPACATQETAANNLESQLREKNAQLTALGRQRLDITNEYLSGNVTHAVASARQKPITEALDKIQREIDALLPPLAAAVRALEACNREKCQPPAPPPPAERVPGGTPPATPGDAPGTEAKPATPTPPPAATPAPQPAPGGAQPARPSEDKPGSTGSRPPPVTPGANPFADVPGNKPFDPFEPGKNPFADPQPAKPAPRISDGLVALCDACNTAAQRARNAEAEAAKRRAEYEAAADAADVAYGEFEKASFGYSGWQAEVAYLRETIAAQGNSSQLAMALQAAQSNVLQWRPLRDKAQAAYLPLQEKTDAADRLLWDAITRMHTAWIALRKCNETRCKKDLEPTVRTVIGIGGNNPFNPTDPVGGGGTTGTPPPSTAIGSIQLSSATYSGGEGGAVLVTVNRVGGRAGNVSVNYATTGGTASPGADFTPVQGTFTWPDGDDAPKFFSIALTDDTLQETTETFTVTLSNFGGGATPGSPTSATVSIADNDGPAPPQMPGGTIQFSLPIYETSEGAAAVTITVTRANGSNGAAGVSYFTGPGSATSPADYSATSGQLTWANGEMGPKTFQVPIVNDTLVENPESFFVTLNNVTGGTATLGAPATATVAIQDNDVAPPTGPCGAVPNAWQPNTGAPYSCSGSCSPNAAGPTVSVNGDIVTVSNFHAGGAATFRGCTNALNSDSSELVYFGQANHRAQIQRLSNNQFGASIESSNGGSCSFSCTRSGP